MHARALYPRKGYKERGQAFFMNGHPSTSVFSSLSGNLEVADRDISLAKSFFPLLWSTFGRMKTP